MQNLISQATGINTRQLLKNLSTQKIQTLPKPTFKKFIKLEMLEEAVNIYNSELVTYEYLPIYSEFLKIYNQTGQSFGYTIYSTQIVLPENDRFFNLNLCVNKNCYSGRTEIHDAAFGVIIDADADFKDRPVHEMLYYHHNFGLKSDHLIVDLPSDAKSESNDLIFLQSTRQSRTYKPYSA